MKKVAKILLIAGGALCLVAAVGLIVYAIALMNSQPLLEQLVEIIRSNPDIPAEAKEAFEQWYAANGAMVMMYAGVSCIVTAVPSFIAGLVALIMGLKKNLTKGNAIAVIVVTVLLGGGIVNLAGGILGVIGAAKEEKAAEVQYEER